MNLNNNYTHRSKQQIGFWNLSRVRGQGIFWMGLMFAGLSLGLNKTESIVSKTVSNSEVISASTAVSVVDPVQWVKTITEKVLLELRNNQSRIRANSDNIYPIVDRLVFPHVDFDEMAKWVAGRNAWTRASSAQQKRFIEQFRKLVVRTYGNSLNHFANEELRFLPLRKDYANQKRIVVSSYVTQKNKPEPLRVDYRLIQNSTGQWKFYDLIVEGVSLLTGYQAQFSDDARSRGLDFVTERIIRLQKHNANAR